MTSRISTIFVAASWLVLATSQSALAQDSKVKNNKAIERGRYLVKIGGCNDCHTAGYAASEGRVPEKEWLMGDQLGWQGQWGTTYPVNLRLYVQTLTEKEWVRKWDTTPARPPMPWFNLRDMTVQDRSAIYRYIRYLGPAGQAAPAYLPPGQQPAGPFVQFPAPPKP